MMKRLVVVGLGGQTSSSRAALSPFGRDDFNNKTLSNGSPREQAQVEASYHCPNQIPLRS